MHIGVTGGELCAGSKARPEMIRTILNSMIRFEAALATLDKAVRAVGERVSRRATNSRWMNG